MSELTEAGTSELVIRRATEADIAAVVFLLADDALGRLRESPDDLTPYGPAFARLTADPNQFLAVAERDGVVIGTLQLTFIPGLSRRGSTRAIVEAVRVSSSLRGGGVGTALMAWVAEESRRRGCHVIQLTSDHTRTDAHRFYARLGYTASHVGFKLDL